MTTLTDRYVWAVTRLLPEQQRGEIDLELRSSIGDMVEARDDGDEAAVLRELGNPSRLAAAYGERPHYLVGPEDFPEYLRILKLVAAVAIPGIAFLAALGAVVDDAAVGGELVGVVVSTMFTTAVHVGFWVTLFYAVRARVQPDQPWTLDSLPDAPADERVSLSDTVFELVVVLVSIGAIVWDRQGRLGDGDGDGAPFLHPSLWDGWIFVIIGLLVAGGLGEGDAGQHHDRPGDLPGGEALVEPHPGDRAGQHRLDHGGHADRAGRQDPERLQVEQERHDRAQHHDPRHQDPDRQVEPADAQVDGLVEQAGGVAPPRLDDGPEERGEEEDGDEDRKHRRSEEGDGASGRGVQAEHLAFAARRDDPGEEGA